MHKDKRYTAKPLYEQLKTLPVRLNNKPLEEAFSKTRILQEHPEVICNKYSLVYSSSINNPKQTKLIALYFRTTVRVSLLAYQGYKT